MANNVDIPGTGARCASEDIGGVHYQRLKLVLGAYGVDDGAISGANPIPITGSLTNVTGTISLPTGAATEATLAGRLAPADTLTGISTVTNLAQLGGSAIAMNTGVRSAGTQRVTISTDDIVPASQSGTWNITNVSGTVSLPTGASTESTLSTLNGKVTACNTGAVVLAAGTANIGDVDVLSIAAGTNRIGAVYEATGQLVDEVPTLRTVNRAFVNASLSGNTAVVAAQGVGVRIRVLSVFAVGTLAVTVKFQSATTDITAGFPFAANGGMVLPHNPHGWFQTNANEALNINLGVATATGCQVTWVQAT